MAEEVGRMRVNVNVSSLEQSERGAVFGEIFVEHGALEFPERNWSDYVVVVLGWWCAACTGLVRGDREQELMFMDGPFLLKVQVDDGNVWTSEFQRLRAPQAANMVEFRPLDTMPNGLRFASNVFLDSLIDCSKTVLAECDQRGWDTDDIRGLRRAATILDRSR